MQAWKARKSVSLLSAQPTEILGTKRKLPRQRALGLELGWIPGRINLARAGSLGGAGTNAKDKITDHALFNSCPALQGGD